MIKWRQISIEVFTYKDYLKYIKFINVNCNKLREDNEDYHIKENIIHQEHDKIFRKILEDKTEVVKFLNKVLELKYKINEKEIEKYNTRYITKELKNEEADIVYKLKDKNIFFLIEHQTRIDYSMPLRILEYEVDIIKSAIDIRKLKQKEYKLPEVIPIVLYTGRKRWNANKYIKESQEKLNGYKEKEFAKYNLVDVNNYEEDELLKEQSFLSKAMLIEKANQLEKLPAIIEKIIEEMNIKVNTYNKKQKELLIKIIKLPLAKRLGKEKIDEFTNKLKEKGGENMLAVLDMVEEENKMLIAKGMKKEQEKIVKKMLEEKVEIAFIEKITGLKAEKIEKIKNKYKL